LAFAGFLLAGFVRIFSSLLHSLVNQSCSSLANLLTEEVLNLFALGIHTIFEVTVAVLERSCQIRSTTGSKTNVMGIAA
jgi:hypothetical protein